MMKRMLCILMVIVFVSTSAVAQRSRIRGRGYKFQGASLYKGDTIDHYSLVPIYVFDKPIDFRRYQRLVAAVKKVYPLAQVAKAKMEEAEAELLRLDKRDQKAYIKNAIRRFWTSIHP